MNEPLPFSRGQDPLHRDDPVAFEVVLPVLGIPTRFRSNAHAIVDAAEQSFGGWRAHADHLAGDSSGEATVTLFVHHGSEGPEDHAPVRYRSRDGRRLLLSTRGSQAVVEPVRRDVLGWVTPSLVQDRAHFRYAVLEAVTYALLSPLDRYPLHAAAVERDGLGLLLVGPSGVGKSTLTYAAARAGIAVLAEDLVHLQLDPALRVWGLTPRLNLLESARSHFPELAGVETTLMANGERKLSVDLAPLGAVSAVPVIDRIRVCVLEREEQRRNPSLEPLAESELLAALDVPAETGFDIFADQIRSGLAPLAAGGGWRLSLGRDPNDAVPFLERLLDPRLESGDRP